MYHVPSNQNEHSLFRIELDETVDEPAVDLPRYPKGTTHHKCFSPFFLLISVTGGQ